MIHGFSVIYKACAACNGSLPEDSPHATCTNCWIAAVLEEDGEVDRLLPRSANIGTEIETVIVEPLEEPVIVPEPTPVKTPETV